MKREDVIQLAREACDKTKVDAFYNGYWTITQDELERVIHLAIEKAVAEERERCASVIEGRAVHQPGPKLVTLEFNQAAHCALATQGPAMTKLFRRFFTLFVFRHFLGQRFRWYRRWFGGRWECHYIDICHSFIWLDMHPDRKWPDWRQPCSFGTPEIEDYPVKDQP